MPGVELLGAEAPLWRLAPRAGGDAAAGQPRHCGCHWTPLHLDVVVPLLEPALARAEAAGMRPETGIRETAWGRLVTTADPSDHRRCPLPFTGDGHDGIARAPA
ncbi:VOC family protein [Stenotrophomonas pictorum]|uniref:VOC family protein n=2 Tax=Stenotrophomonas pictorum TaxID=86184 RepID=UPI000A9758E0|nr:VOC family protein [Stenotrophomonas pictorum]